MDSSEPTFKIQGLELTAQSATEMQVHLYGSLEYYDREEMILLRDFLDEWLSQDAE